MPLRQGTDGGGDVEGFQELSGLGEMASSCHKPELPDHDRTENLNHSRCPPRTP
jgi:hypothetical protein